MQSEAEINRAVEKYADMVQRICFYHLKNRADTEDVFQNVFLKYMLQEEPFQSEEHEKAWLARVAINACRDYLKSFFRRKMVPLEAVSELGEQADDGCREVLEAVLSLPKRYKDAIYLHYFEGYTAAEIGQIIGKKENTVYSLLSRGRELLRRELGGDGIGE